MSGDNIYVRLLKGARIRIEEGNDTYVCNALYNSGSALGAHNAAERIKAWIHQALNRQATLGNWLYDRGIPFDDQFPWRMRDHRVAWIDRMIEQWKDATEYAN